MKFTATSLLHAAVLAGSTLLLPMAAQAQYRHDVEPNYRYERDNEYDEEYRADYDRRDERLAGEVSRISGRNSIEIRSGRRYVTVRLREEAESRFLNVGDYVILRGEWDGGSFLADQLRRGREDDWNRDEDDRYGDTRRVDFSSFISRIFSSREIEVRGDNGRYYRVEVREGVRGFAPNSRVRIVGLSTGHRIRVDRLFWANGGVVPGRATSGTTVDFPARIQFVNEVRGVAAVRGDNGQSYQIRSRSFDGFRAGDRVRIIGDYRNGIVDVSRIYRIR